MKQMTKDDVRKMVREHYAQNAGDKPDRNIAMVQSTCCTSGAVTRDKYSQELGYSQDEVDGVPDGANLELGCGNPQTIAGLKLGETVLDLGSGGGFDCFLAAGAVGPTGRVIGVDMTPEMVSKARQNATKGNYQNVEFRLGEIEHLPVVDNSVNVLISNCVINLSPEKKKVFREAFRVLKSGGRLAISDVVALSSLPAEFKENQRMHCGCIGGAITIEAIEQILADLGFDDIVIEVNRQSAEFIRSWFPESNLDEYVGSAAIQAVKP